MQGYEVSPKDATIPTDGRMEEGTDGRTATYPADRWRDERSVQFQSSAIDSTRLSVRFGRLISYVR